MVLVHDICFHHCLRSSQYITGKGMVEAALLSSGFRQMGPVVADLRNFANFQIRTRQYLSLSRSASYGDGRRIAGMDSGKVYTVGVGIGFSGRSDFCIFIGKISDANTAVLCTAPCIRGSVFSCRRCNRSLVWIKMASAFAWQVAFLIISGLVFLGVLVMITPQTMDPILLLGLCGAYVIAWFAGFVTPGAPAGVGVRELALLFLLKGYVAEADLLLAVVIGRMVTVVGDLSYFCAASLMGFRKSLS